MYSAECNSGWEDVMTGCDDCGGAGPHTPSLEAEESFVSDPVILLSVIIEFMNFN